MSPRHSDTNTGWINRRFARLEKMIRESNAAKKLQAATIGKGGITVKDGGSIVGKYPPSLGGGEGLRIGPHVGAKAEAGYAIQVNDEVGTVIFAATRSTPSTDTPGGTSGVFATADMVFIDDGTGTAFTIFGGAAEVASTADISLRSVTGTKIDHSTTGASANTFIDPSDNRIWRSTSSAQYKTDVADAEVDPAAVLQMRGITFRDKAAVAEHGDDAPTYMGFLAEDLDALGLGGFVTYREGNPEAIAYDRLSVALLAVLKDQDARLAALEQAAAEA